MRILPPLNMLKLVVRGIVAPPAGVLAVLLFLPVVFSGQEVVYDYKVSSLSLETRLGLVVFYCKLVGLRLL